MSNTRKKIQTPYLPKGAIIDMEKNQAHTEIVAVIHHQLGNELKKSRE